jgi:hypothetical protein
MMNEDGAEKNAARARFSNPRKLSARRVPADFGLRILD